MTDKKPKTPRSSQADLPSVDNNADAASKDADRAASDVKADSTGTATTASQAADKAAQTGNAPSDKKPEDPGNTSADASRPADTGKSPAKVSRPDDTGKSSAPAGSASSSQKKFANSSDTPDAAASAAKPGKTARKPSVLPLVVLGVAVILLGAGLWYQHVTTQEHIQQLESQIRSSSDEVRQARQQAQQAADALNQLRDRLAAVAGDLRESRAELDGLSRAFQTVTDRGSDLVLLNEIDHLVMIAQQQLQLNGNVANAIISLEAAQAQLARANRPALASLQQTINGDLDRLRAATTVDIARLSSRLDELAGLVGQAPLLVPDDSARDSSMDDAATRPQPPVRPDAITQEGGNWWERALARTGHWMTHTVDSIRYDLGRFISVRRVDDAAALLISPDQASRFRDSLRQRIMMAQLALMMDQSLIWETETRTLLTAIETRFDPQSALTREAIRIARDVADTAIDTPLPDLSNSIAALQVIHEQLGAAPASGDAEAGDSSQGEPPIDESGVTDGQE